MQEVYYTNASMDSLLRQGQSNTIYISQPRIELKYRGVSYFIRDISNIDVRVVEIDPRIVRTNSLKYTNDSNSHSTSEKSSSN